MPPPDKSCDSVIATTPELSPQFVCHDWCGWNEKYGRFTHMPSGSTLVCRAWMGQSDWDSAQLEWFSKLDGDLIVHKCPTGPYRETGDTMGSVSEIVTRLNNRLQ